MAHDPETRAAAKAALLAGQGVASVAREYSLPESTVARWRKKARADAGMSDDIGGLLLRFLAESLETLRQQAVVFRDRDWLLAQSAGELAILHGVMTDKAVRLLEALADSKVEPASPNPTRPRRIDRHV